MKYTLDDIIKNFEMTKPKKSVFGNYRIEGNKLVYQAKVTEKLQGFYDEKDFAKFYSIASQKIKTLDAQLFDNNGLPVLLESLTKNYEPNHEFSLRFTEENLISVKLNETSLLNNSILDLIGRTVAYGNESRNNRETEIQRILKKNYLSIDLNNFPKSDFSTFKVIEKGTLEFKECEVRLGYSSFSVSTPIQSILFSLDGKLYLSDVDRRETRHGRANYFLAEVSKKCASIDDAYTELTPSFVLAESLKHGKKSVRIGQVFFVPCEQPKIPVLNDIEKFCVLAYRSYVGQPVIKHLTDLDQKEIETIANKAMAKIPVSGSIGVGRGIHVGKLIEIDGVQYAQGEIRSENRVSTSLDSWHRVVARSEFKTDKEE